MLGARLGYASRYVIRIALFHPQIFINHPPRNDGLGQYAHRYDQEAAHRILKVSTILTTGSVRNWGRPSDLQAKRSSSLTGTRAQQWTPTGRPAPSFHVGDLGC